MAPSAPSNEPGRWALRLVVYAAMLAVAVGLFFLIREVGSGLVAPSGALTAAKKPAPPATSDTLTHVLLALGVVIVLARAMGSLFKRINQPPVIGEVIAGIMLGPSLLGRIAPEVSAFVLPPNIAPFLGVIAQVGVILFMFLVGLHLDTGLLKQRTQTSIAISHASITVPFTLGAALALWLYPRLSSSEVPFTVFALFMGVSMSVTAFPVLARILTDRRLHTSRMGSIALACAAVDDVTAWCMLAFVVGVVQSNAQGALLTVLLTAAYIAVMLVVVRPAAVWMARRYEHPSRVGQSTLAVVCVALLASALATELIGIHALFGAFLLGAIIPHDSALARAAQDKLEDTVVVLFLPAFFAFTGMRTQIGLVSGWEQWLVCGVIILVASAGKFGGTLAAAKLTGLSWRDSAALGVLMNTRGLMELIVLNVGLDLGVISPSLFAMLVLMAVVTTLATSPALHLLTGGSEELPSTAAQKA
jgi:Kef-type K+ transport system membrane component KefB